jgi:hypothetical protein
MRATVRKDASAISRCCTSLHVLVSMVRDANISSFPATIASADAPLAMTGHDEVGQNQIAEQKIYSGVRPTMVGKW